ncbi:extracellular solute-binding protein [Streptomyces sp. NPDC056500]|uniref:extracellular solute-binding protein n=1 Tax=Streptomyces sp. NPDC056500 TaxID=3345840 RepID=UPI0036967FF6
MTPRRLRWSAYLGTFLLLGTAACGSSDDSNGSSGGDKLTVWLAVDARESWPGMVKSANERFNKEHPGVDVEIQYQQWPSKNQKLDAVLAGRDTPDVVEMGNSETANYILNGAFIPLDAKKFDQSDTWLEALSEACQSEGKTYCVPYYAGARIGVYRTDYFSQAGVTAPPETFPELISALDKLKEKYGSKDPNFSALYLPGRYWSAAMAFLKDAGGEMAVKTDGTWKGALSSPKSIQGLTQWKKLIDSYYVGDRSKDNGDQPAVIGQGKVGVFYGNTWEAQASADSRSGGNPALKGKLATFTFPGPSGEVLPPFLGGSTLAIPAKSRNQELAAEWIRIFTDRESQRQLIAANTLPNNTVQLKDVPADGINGPAAKAAERGWITPQAPGWTSVEKSNILPETLERIATGKDSVEKATKEADRRINAVINER